MQDISLYRYTVTVVGTSEQIDVESKRYTEGNLFFGAAVNPRDSDLKVTESSDGKSLIFNGKKAFSTGSKVSDLTVLEGVLEVFLFTLIPFLQTYILTLGASYLGNRNPCICHHHFETEWNQIRR